MEHWLRDEAVDKCMKCSVEFTFTERKHHCRDCGKIFCHRYYTAAVLERSITCRVVRSQIKSLGLCLGK